MTESMIERVARALCKADGHNPDEDWRAVGDVMLTVIVKHPERWRKYIGKARAAIEAIREPTEAMVIDGLVGLVRQIEEIQGQTEPVQDGQVLTDEEAVRRYLNLGARLRSGAEIIAAWRAMISAALSEHPSKD